MDGGCGTLPDAPPALNWPAETLTAILRDDPPDLVTSSTTGVSPGLARVIQHCLGKNSAERFQSASDVAFALEALSGTSTSTEHAMAGGAPRRGAWLPWGVAILVAVLSAGLVVANLRRPTGVDALTRLSIQLPQDLSYLGAGLRCGAWPFHPTAGESLCQRNATRRVDSSTSASWTD